MRISRRTLPGVLVLSCALASGCSPEAASETVAQRSSAIVSSAGLQLKLLTNSCVANQVQDIFQVTNTGTTSVKLSDIKIKLWANDTSGQSVVPHIWTGGCATGVNGSPSCVHQVTGVTAAATPFTPACGPDANHLANWEITISDTDGGTLAPGATWGNIQSGLNLASFANFTPGTATWYSSCLGGSSYVSDPHFAVYFQGNLVFSNGITAPDCRGPHGTQPIPTYVPPPPAPTVGPAPATKVISLAIDLPLRSLASLQTFVAQASDPTSPTYRHYLAPADVLATYSPLASDYNALTAWAQGKGFKVVTYPNRVGIDVTGTVAQIEQAFFVNVILATRPDGSQYFRLDRQPSVDLGVPLLGVSGLDDFQLPRLAAGMSPIPGTFASSDVRGTYLGGAGSVCNALTGAGQSIGIFSLLTGFTQSDITAYATNTGLSGVPTVQVQTTNDPNGLPPTQAPSLPATGNQEEGELSLDIEAAIAMAPQAQIVVFEGTNRDSVLKAMTNNPTIGQLSSSFDAGVSPLTPQLFTLMAAQGQSFFTASGDFAAYQPQSAPTATCPAVTLSQIAAGTAAPPPDVIPLDFRAMPYVTVVGGTVFTTAGTAPAENAWVGSGGGIASNLPIPTYQAGLNPGNAELSATNRNLPDVSALAQAMYVVYTNCNNTAPVGITGNPIPNTTSVYQPCPTASLTPGQTMVSSGTSVSSPLWAGFMALVNQQGRNAGLGPVGFANPAIYQVGKDATRYPTSFHDVGASFGGTATNKCGFTYNAQAGYDLITGWGAPRCGLIAQLATHPSVSVTVSGDAAGPFICIGGTGFSAGGTVSVQYTGIPADNAPDGTPGTRSLGTLPVGTDARFGTTDNEISVIQQAVATGTTNCTAADIASGIVSIQATDNTTAITATTLMPAAYWCALGQPALGGGCSTGGRTVFIRYQQYGACHFVPPPAPGGFDTGPHSAYVVFRLEQISNDEGLSIPFSFQQPRLFVQQGATRDLVDPNLAIYPNIFGPFAAPASLTVDPLSSFDFTFPGDVALVVTTTAENGVPEAGSTIYQLDYAQGPTDPPVSMFRANVPGTPFQANDDCSQIGLTFPP